MAIRELFSVVQSNGDVARDTTVLADPYFLAGMVVARDTTTGLIRKANRANTGPADTWVGLSADDHSRTGCTMIIPDPVGANYIDTNGNFVANNNGFYVATKRALLDYLDEPVTNVSDLTSGASGYQGPRRGVGIYTTPSAEFVTDMFVAVKTASSGGTTADSNSAYSFLPNDLLTFGAGANAGKLVALNVVTDGPTVARVNKYDAAAGLLYITTK
jgi:hypothetical protein